MFVVIGTQSRKEDMGCLPELWLCPRCRRWVHLQIIRERRWFTVFWVPLFPVHSDQYYQCPSCGLTMQMDPASYSPQQDDILQPQPGSRPELTDKGAKPTNPSMLQKGARQAGRLAGRFKRYLDD